MSKTEEEDVIDLDAALMMSNEIVEHEFSGRDTSVKVKLPYGQIALTDPKLCTTTMYGCSASHSTLFWLKYDLKKFE